MPVDFKCPHCGKSTRVADEFAGQSGPCQACGQQITIPQRASSGATTKASGASIAIVIIGVACGGLLLLTGVLVALLLPAIQSSREAARRMSCSNNLKQIALALHNYEAVHRTLPPAYIPDADGKPMHSWRVLILPYIEQQLLYEQYDFDKPWDSPENLAVAQLDVPAYRCPSDPNQAPSANQPMQTSYMVVSGQGAMFDGPQAHSLSQIKDGLSNTLAVVEATGQNVGWTQPRDITPQELKDLVAGKGEPQARSSYHPGGFNAALGDGSIRFISNSVATSVLDALLTIAGND